MMRDDHQYLQNSAARRGRVSVVAIIAACLVAGWTATGRAQSKLDTETLIGDAVSDLGPKYSDVDEAIKRFNNGDIVSTRALLEEARKKNKALAPTDLMLAKMYLISGKIAQGRNSLEKTVADFPADPEAYIILGEIDLAQGGPTEAEALFEKAMSLTEQFNENPKRKRNFGIRARWGRSQVYERRKNWQAMGADLRDILKIDEHHAAARFKMGIALCRLGNFPQGKAAMDAAQKDDEKKILPGTSVTLAWLYDQTGKPDDAKKAFQDAIRENPKDASPVVQYAQWLLKTGANNEADTLMAGARKDFPDVLDVYVLSGATALLTGKLKDAEQHFMTALGKAPGRLDIVNQLALLLIEQDNPESQNRAVAFAELNAKANENSADARVTQAWVYYKLKRTAEANQALRAGLQLGNLTPDSSYFVAKMISTDSKDPQQIDGAKRLLIEALSTDNPGIFIHRKDAQELLKQLGGG